MASLGYLVNGIDLDKDKICSLHGGTPLFFEPGFQELLNKVLGLRRLIYSSDISDSLGALDSSIGAEPSSKRVTTSNQIATRKLEGTITRRRIRRLGDNYLSKQALIRQDEMSLLANPALSLWLKEIS